MSPDATSFASWLNTAHVTESLWPNKNRKMSSNLQLGSGQYNKNVHHTCALKQHLAISDIPYICFVILTTSDGKIVRYRIQIDAEDRTYAESILHAWFNTILRGTNRIKLSFFVISFYDVHAWTQSLLSSRNGMCCKTSNQTLSVYWLIAGITDWNHFFKWTFKIALLFMNIFFQSSI